MPVIASATVAWEWLSAPLAISTAVASLTAPWLTSVWRLTPSISVLATLL